MLVGVHAVDKGAELQVLQGHQDERRVRSLNDKLGEALPKNARWTSLALHQACRSESKHLLVTVELPDAHRAVWWRCHGSDVSFQLCGDESEEAAWVTCPKDGGPFGLNCLGAGSFLKFRGKISLVLAAFTDHQFFQLKASEALWLRDLRFRVPEWEARRLRQLLRPEHQVIRLAAGDSQADAEADRTGLARDDVLALSEMGRKIGRAHV